MPEVLGCGSSGFWGRKKEWSVAMVSATILATDYIISQNTEHIITLMRQQWLVNIRMFSKWQQIIYGFPYMSQTRNGWRAIFIGIIIIISIIALCEWYHTTGRWSIIPWRQRGCLALPTTTCFKRWSPLALAQHKAEIRCLHNFLPHIFFSSSATNVLVMY